jgi:hypothetical protein
MILFDEAAAFPRATEFRKDLDAVLLRDKNAEMSLFDMGASGQNFREDNRAAFRPLHQYCY